MKATVSPSTRRRYPLTMICQVWRVARSSVYAAALPEAVGAAPSKRGPKTRVSDTDVVAAIRDILRETPLKRFRQRFRESFLDHAQSSAARSFSCAQQVRKEADEG